MLGWFKKTFGKSKPQEESEALEPPGVEEVEQETADLPLDGEGSHCGAEAGESPVVEQLDSPVPEEPATTEVEPTAGDDEPQPPVAPQEDVLLAEEEAVEDTPPEPEPEPEPEPAVSELSPVETAQDMEVEEGEHPAPAEQDAEAENTLEEDQPVAPPVVLLDEAGAEREIVPASPLAEKTQAKPAAKSMFSRLRDRLGKTRDAFVYRIDSLFLGKKEIDQDLFDQLEEILITADLGVATTLDLMDRARKKVKRDQLSDPQALKRIIRDEILAYIEASEQPAELVMPEQGPFVIMVVGVNGVGKTTTIGKVAAKFTRSGQSVLLVAGDTFRAAAINQLRIWGERVGTEVIAQQPGADPSSVVFDGMEYGAAHKYDVVIVDTAGRLHTSVNLMEELKKIKRVIGKKIDGAPHEVMLVLDATTGQNGIAQAKMFNEAVGVSGLALTKLDGTAKGGIVANVCRELGIPVRFIGIGEQIDDLRDFEAQEFVNALFAE